MSDTTTPSSRWAADGQRDPHGDRYACERAALALGNLTDDELANAVFLHGNEQPTMADMAAGKALAGIVYLTAAKDRIRWLSRALSAATAQQPAELAEQQGVELPPLPEPRDMGYTTDSVMRTYTMTGYTSEQMQDYARFALAARQPGAQEAVAVVGPDFTLLWVGSGPISPIVERHGLKRGSLLYAAPPAHGIDLGQLWEQAHAAMREHRKGNRRDCFVLDCLKGDVQKLIDQRDAAPGVE